MPDPELLACRRCGEQLAASRAEGSLVTYYRCNCCGTTGTTADPVALRSVARAVDEAPAATDDAEIDEWRRRLDAFNAHADQTDPYQRLGLPPSATLGEARERFHELAMERHPDRGGEAEALGAIVDAFDRIRDRFAAEVVRERQAGAKPKRTARPNGAPILPRKRPESWSRWSPAQTETALAKRQ